LTYSYLFQNKVLANRLLILKQRCSN